MTQVQKSTCVVRTSSIDWVDCQNPSSWPLDRKARKMGFCPLNVTATFNKGKKHRTENVYIVEDLAIPFLSFPAATALQLVVVRQAFPKVYNGLGKMQGEYIVLKPGAMPFSLSTPRRISLPRLPK